MRILLSWLQEYCDIRQSPEEIAKLLTNAGIEVDHIEHLVPSFQGVVAARIEEVTPLESGHVLVRVFDGKTSHTVVCGAKNCKPSQITAYAPPTSVVAGQQVKEAVVAGASSRGFLCSEKELGLSEYHDGIMELDAACTPGTLLDAFFTDVAFDVTVTPNLGHCLSVLGIARELSAFAGISMKQKPWLETEPFLDVSESEKLLKVTVEDDSLCPRYSALCIDNVQVGPSKSAVRIRLERCGIRSINNIVDSTNYVSHELGQPMHAFDASKVANSHIVVRKSIKGEKLLFLDGALRQLAESSIVIADDEKVLALGGIMGGELSGVNEKTNRIIFESAHFLPTSIRKVSKQLGVQSDSSRRFERGSDQNITMQALKLACSLLQDGAMQIVAKSDIGMKKPYRTVQCRLSRASAILGYEVSVNEVESAFAKLFLVSSWDGQDTFTVQVPSFRHDVTEEIDLIEEIGRLVGLEGPPGHRPVYSASTLAHDPRYLFTNEVRSRLLCEGLQEVLCCNLISQKMANAVINHPITADRLVSVLNPLSIDQSIMRPSLLPGLLDSLQRNLSHRTMDFNCFEIGHVHLKENDKFAEPLCFAVMLSGHSAPHHFLVPDSEVNFFDLKGILENLFSSLGFTNFELQKSDLSILHPGRQAKICVQGVHVGMIGELHPELLRSFDISQRAYYAECDMQELLKLDRKERKMHELAQFPSSERDWTITLNKSVQLDALFAKINEYRPAILEHFALDALFEHEKLGQDRHNVTIHFVYRDREKTVSQEVVDRAHNELVERVGATFK